MKGQYCPPKVDADDLLLAFTQLVDADGRLLASNHIINIQFFSFFFLKIILMEGQ
jgi:hypothetical protein